ncbi:MAG: HAMP domain-containing sensor histidine kinase [Pacificimonas sp.]|jgi:signal transduction histidine kinase|nr:HAMP domain-containing sensor histidine kinase [Pacificimonas sp.]
MYRDQRLTTIADWPTDTDDARIAAIGQLLMLLNDDRGSDDLRAAAVEQVRTLWRLLSAGAQNRVASLAKARGVDLTDGSAATGGSVAALFGVDAQPDADEPVSLPSSFDRPDPETLATQTLESRRDSAERLGELIARIDAFRERRRAGADDGQRWHSDAGGLIVEGFRSFAASKPVYLTALAFVDPDAATRRIDLGQPLRNCALTVDGDARFLNAEPVFADESGRFEGYRGTLSARSHATTTPLLGENVAELAHEVLTPLNAIMGYAQMIEDEILGPASPQLKAGTAELIGKTSALLEAVETLGDMSVIDRGGAGDGPSELVFVLPALERAVSRLEAPAQRRGVTLAASGNPAAAIVAPRRRIEQVIDRLAATLLAHADAGETLTLHARDGGADFDLPAALRMRSLQSLWLDPPAKLRTEGAPILGLSIALRHADRILNQLGGHILVEGGQLCLHAEFLDRAEEGLAS